ncbi:MAG: hypothetical protein HN509_03010 [Halobacteriovoraceae bacterium]|jgi:ubiquinone biosynthesis protein|nr:hypothetical protein [Halobacteriovoraceae bacterium]MBT5095176.1 hypothetical protein [Halobacteriovoraceae bacterium]
MDLIRTSLNITKTIRNVTRLREIVSVFARNGFDEFITSPVAAKIPNFVLPKSKRSLRQEMEEKGDIDWGQSIGFRLRKCFEELGPAFIKFGQLLSSREDIFDKSFINEMKLLRDKVKPIQFSEVRESIEESLNKPIDSVFESIDEHPIGTASIGVVFKAILKSGEDVVIKVRRPGIEKTMETDFSILLYLSSQVERVSDEVKFLGLSRIVSDFAISLQNELNFNVEALNADKLRRNIASHDKQKTFLIPVVYKDLTSEGLLVMERLKGIPFSDQAQISLVKDELTEKLTEGLQIFLKSFLKDGFFHADLHGGNFFYLDNGQIGIIDFGLMGTLSAKARKSFIAIVYSMLTFNYENLVYEFLDVAEYETIPDVPPLIHDVRDALSPYIGLTVQQTNFTQVFQEVMGTLRKHQLYIPRDWFVVFRGLITLDGVGKSVGVDFDIFGMLEGDIQEIIKDTYSKDELLEEAIWTGRDILGSSRIFPRHLKWFLREWAKKGYAHELIHRGHEDSVNSITGALSFLGFYFIAGLLILSGVLMVQGLDVRHWTDVPYLSWIFWGLSIFFLFRGGRSLKKV